ncbi:MAG: response regulator, partial [Deltaproteobacteria bacterium]|nr:response regulator [Deltaproteobacteria bacterium]
MESFDLTNAKVLVADDEPKVRALVAGCVRSLGCEAIEARDGDEAWQLAQSHRVDVVVLDVMMPGMSGWEVCRRVKGSVRTVRGMAPKVLMLTGIGEHLNEMTSPLFAADDWIDKPFGLQQLRDKIAELGQLGLSESSSPGEPSGPTLRKARPSAEQLTSPEPTDVETAVEAAAEPAAPPEPPAPPVAPVEAPAAPAPATEAKAAESKPKKK